MDYASARKFLMAQGTALIEQKNPDAFLMLLKQGKPPIPGQMTSILLALKVVLDTVKEETNLDRPLVLALHLLAMESAQLFEAGRRAGVDWPPLLKEDLTRLATSVKNIFGG